MTREGQPIWWIRTLPNVAMLLFAAIGVYWDATVAITLAAVCVVIGGAYAIASGGRQRTPAPSDDQAWAERILSTSVAAETAATSIEWLGLIGATFLMATQAPLVAIIAIAPFLSFAVLVIVASAFAQVLWERRSARKVLRSSP